VSIYSEERPAGAGDLSRLRIDRDAGPRRRWLPWAALAVLAAAGAAVYPSARVYIEERRAPEVEIARVVQPVVSASGSTDLPVLVATGYVIARKSSDVGVKVGGRLGSINFEEGTRVRKGEVIAEIEHADLAAQLAAAKLAVAESETQLAQAVAQRAEDDRNLERQRALARDGIATTATLTAAEAADQVSAARVRAAEAAINSARARVKITEEALENTNIRAPFDGVVIKKRAEVGETVSPFGVQGQATREGGAIATIADLRELEVQTEVSENSVAKLTKGMPGTVTIQAYQDQPYKGRLREIFPSADRSKSIVEVRVTILDADARVKPEMSASVTFEEPRSAAAQTSSSGPSAAPSTPPVRIPKRAVAPQADGSQIVWVVANAVATPRQVRLGAERLDQVEVQSGLVPGEAVVLNPPAALTSGARVRVK
jgi:HlyD family secretion protein